MADDSHHQQSCARCGARYEVLVTEKVGGTEDERVFCDCGWPLKDWIGIKAYIFKRLPTQPARVGSFARR
jgi:hypothetical protein